MYEVMVHSDNNNECNDDSDHNRRDWIPWRPLAYVHLGSRERLRKQRENRLDDRREDQCEDYAFESAGLRV